MIFKRWFKPKWQHDKAAVRQAAIESLDFQTPDEKQILHELAFNDGTESVRKAALYRLNDFSLWWQASKHDSSERLRQTAEQQLVDMLLNNQVDSTLKQQFIEQCHRSSILEKLACTENNVDLRIALLDRLQKQELWLAALNDQNLPVTVRAKFIHNIKDDKALERLAKHSETALKDALQTALLDRQQQKQKPERLRKQITLLLAKLNAVREKSDLAVAEQEWQQLSVQWQQLHTELLELPSDEAAELTTKFNKINQLTDDSLTPRLTVWREETARQQQRELSTRQLNQYRQQLSLLQQSLAQLIANGQLDQFEGLQTAFLKLNEQIKQSQFTQIDLSPLTRLQQTIADLFERLPQIAEAMAAAARLIAEMTAHPLPNSDQLDDGWRLLKQWQQQWHQLSRDAGDSLPLDFQQSVQAIEQQWLDILKPAQVLQQKQLKQLKGKLAEIRRLHDEGRYNVVFGLWKGVQETLGIAPALNQQLEKELTDIASIIEKLQGLQAFVATPRKQQLIEDMQQLLTDTTLTAPVRAKAVKLARAQWNSLGKADDALEDQLNETFNQLSEQAFAPCRQYYAEQDALRNESLAKRQQIIVELQALSSSDLTGVALDKVVSQLQKQWRQAGFVAKEQHQKLHQAFNNALRPLKERVHLEQQQNKQQKQLLIQQAAALVHADDSSAQMSALKSLQQIWKTTGSAGRQLDQPLWLEFKAHSDAFFARRDAERSALQQQQQLQRDASNQRFSALELQLTDANVDLNALSQAVLAVDTNDDPASLVRKMTLHQHIEQMKQERAQQTRRDEYRQLFDALTNPAVEQEQLPSLYRLVFNQQQESMSRLQLTLAIEWVAGVESPAAQQVERQQVQMQLLSEKLNQGHSVTLEHLFSRWLRLGPVSSDELDMLARVRAIFVK